MRKKRQLPIPPIAEESPDAVEVARVWVADGSQHVSLATGLWPDPGAWGLLLVDLARHIARAYEQTNGPDSHDALLLIRRAFDAEWDSPTDQPEGRVLVTEATRPPRG